MKVKRKQGKEVALSGWCDHETNFVEFVPPSPDGLPCEDLSIEWSSEEELKKEDQQTPHRHPSKIQVPVRRISPYVRKNNESGNLDNVSCRQHGSVTQFSTCSKPLRSNTTVNEQLKISESNKNSDHYCADFVYNSQQLSTDYCLPNTKEHSSTRKKQNAIVLESPSIQSNFSDNEDDLHISQMSSSLSSPDTKDIFHQINSDGVDNCQIEPLSPILGSQKISRKSLKVPTLEKFITPEKQDSGNELSNIPKEVNEKSMITKVTLDIPVKEEEPIGSLIKKRRTFNDTFHPSVRIECGDISQVEWECQESTADSLRTLPGHYTKCEAETLDKNQVDTPMSCNKFEAHLPRNTRCIESVEDYYSKSHVSVKEIQQDTKGIVDVMKPSEIHSRFSTIRDSFLQREEFRDLDSGADLIDYSPSKVFPHDAGESESQEDYYIDIITTPQKYSQNKGTIASLEGTSPSISFESTTSPSAVSEVGSSSIKSGFNWVRNLQQHTTPQKSCVRDSKEAAESTKKKPKKDGEAARMRRLLVSWQSSINTWAHQLYLTSLFRSTPPLSHTTSDTPDRKPLLPTYLNVHQQRVKQEVDKASLLPTTLDVLQAKAKARQEQQDMKSVSKVGRSPAVRNLQELLIESPGSSPGVSSLTHIQIPVSKKYLELRVVEVGGRLATNSAVCKVIGSSDKALLRTIKIEGSQKPTKNCNSQNRRKYLVFFALQEHKITSPLQVHDIAKVYSPWQTLNLPAHDVPVLFCSYFTLTKGHDQSMRPRQGQDHTQGTKGHTVLTTWTCSCFTDRTVLPSMCEARFSTSTQNSYNHDYNRTLLTLPSTFSTITDSPDRPQPQVGSHTWTVMEGIERCGGASEVPISLTARFHRSIPKRTRGGKVEEWVFLCQDATGVFCTVRVPNRPLAEPLRALLEARQDGTHTLTHLTISHRLTNTQNPGLFSLILSLHLAYQAAVRSDPHVPRLLASPRPAQTSCFCFTVTLGATRLLHCPEEVVLPLSLPHWSLQQAFEVRSEGERGSLSLFLLYMVESFLHVMSLGNTSGKNQQRVIQGAVGGVIDQDNITLTHKDESIPRREGTEKHKNEVAVKLKPDHLPATAEGDTDKIPTTLNTMRIEKSAVKRLVVADRSSLPSWIPEQGTVMQQAVLRDVVVWRGNVIVDEYSSVHQEETATYGSERVSLSTLLRVLQPLSPSTHQHDLTLLSGTILKIDEDSAYTWLTCSACGSENVQQVGNGGGEEAGVDCSACGGRSSTPSRGYSLHVWINTKAQLEGADVKVKLYQRTIEKLLTTCSGSQVEEHDAGSLLGASVGPLVCVVQGLPRLRSSTIPLSYSLMELPY